MKKLFLSILMMLAFAAPSFATDYFGCNAAQNVNGDSTWCAYADLESISPAACTKAALGNYTAAATVLQANNNLYANGCTVTLNADFNIGTGKLSTEDAGTGANDFAGGSFSMAATRTITANVVAGTTSCLVITSGAKTLTLTGNTTGGSANNAFGIQGTTSNTIVVSGTATGGSTGTTAGISNGTTVTVANVVGGSAAQTYGAQMTATGTVSITGTATGGGNASAYGFYSTSSATTTVVNATGGTVAGADGIRDLGSGGTTITGIMTNTTTSSAASGRITYTPSAASKYIVYGATNYPAQLAAENIKSGVVSGSTTGTYAAGGGGAWGF